MLVAVAAPFVTVNAPPTVARLIPVPVPEPPPVAETVVKFAPNVTPLAFIAGAAVEPVPVAAIELPAAAVTFTVPPPVATRPLPLEVVMARVENAIVRDVLFVRLTAVPPVELLFTVAAAKVIFAFELSILIPVPAGFVIVVEPVTIVVPPPAP